MMSPTPATQAPDAVTDIVLRLHAVGGGRMILSNRDGHAHVCAFPQTGGSEGRMMGELPGVDPDAAIGAFLARVRPGETPDRTGTHAGFVPAELLGLPLGNVPVRFACGPSLPGSPESLDLFVKVPPAIRARGGLSVLSPPGAEALLAAAATPEGINLVGGSTGSLHAALARVAFHEASGNDDARCLDLSWWDEERGCPPDERVREDRIRDALAAIPAATGPCQVLMPSLRHESDARAAVLLSRSGACVWLPVDVSHADLVVPDFLRLAGRDAKFRSAWHCPTFWTPAISPALHAA